MKREAFPIGRAEEVRHWRRLPPRSWIEAHLDRALYNELCRERGFAQGQVYKAIKSGKLIRQPCEVCGAAYAHAHHDDYSKPLEVHWLCPSHHRMAHRACLQRIEIGEMKL